MPLAIPATNWVCFNARLPGSANSWCVTPGSPPAPYQLSNRSRYVPYVPTVPIKGRSPGPLSPRSRLLPPAEAHN